MELLTRVTRYLKAFNQFQWCLESRPTGMGGVTRPNGKWPKEDAIMDNDLIGNWPNG